jgi:hypothetical protein
LNKTLIGRLDALSVYITWFLLATFLIRLSYEQFWGDAQTGIYSLKLFFAFICFAFIHVIFAYFNRCPNCYKMLTAQGFKAPHPNSSGDWSKVVWKWFSGSIVCIHCGKEVNTNDL